MFLNWMKYKIYTHSRDLSEPVLVILSTCQPLNALLGPEYVMILPT